MSLPVYNQLSVKHLFPILYNLIDVNPIGVFAGVQYVLTFINLANGVFHIFHSTTNFPLYTPSAPCALTT